MTIAATVLALLTIPWLSCEAGSVPIVRLARSFRTYCSLAIEQAAHSPVPVLTMLRSEQALCPSGIASLQGGAQSSQSQPSLDTRSEANRLLLTREYVSIGRIPSLTTAGSKLTFLPAVAYPSRRSGVWANEPNRTLMAIVLQLRLLEDMVNARRDKDLESLKVTLADAYGAVQTLFEALNHEPPGQQDNLAKVKKLKARIDQAILTVVVKYARVRSLEVVMTDEVRTRMVSVKFASSPKGAEIQIVDGFDFDATHGHLNESAWLNVSVGSTLDLPDGDYQYRMRWRPTKPWVYNSIPVHKSGLYVLPTGG